MRKLKFFSIGLIPGIILVLFILNKKGASCSGYLPNGRVLAESLTKDFQYLPTVKDEMRSLKIDEKKLRDSLFSLGKINFDKSNAQKKPCPDYLLIAPSKKPKYEIRFEKCDNKVTFTEIKKIN